jgi:salicylate hydroxylase
MEDALVLTDQIVQESGNFESAFQNYQTIRAARTARVQMKARELGEVYHMKGFKRWIRNWMFKRMTQDKFIKSVEWLYNGDFGHDR